MGEQAFLTWGLDISRGVAAIWDGIRELFWRFADLHNLLTTDFGERAIAVLAIFACCVGVVRCIRTAFSR